jgi:hypothetical protein
VLKGEGKPTPDAEPNLEDAIGGLELEQVNTPVSLGCMLATHAFAHQPADQTAGKAMLLIEIGCPSGAE